MPRWLHILAAAILVPVWTATVLLTSDSAPAKPKRGAYVIEVDNAFGLTQGADVKLGGARAGHITTLDLDQRTRRALVGIDLTAPGFDALGADAVCRIRPQSLIGESYVDCQPGTGRRLRAGATLPVSQTRSAIGIDLLNTVLRRPYNERLRIIIGELGAGVAARGTDINAAIGRALPAIDAVNRVLAELAAERHTLADLARNGDRALSGLADRRRDLGRFVQSAERLSRVSARRRGLFSKQFRDYPAFLRELPPSMRALGRVADAQGGLLRELTAGSGRLKQFLDQLGNFSAASVPAVKALAATSRTGRSAARHARPVLRTLDRSAQLTPEVARDARFILDHLDDRRNAVEPDTRSPGGEGFTGLEAILQYVFNQSLSLNIFDANSYLLKVGLLQSSACAPYADAARARAHPECSTALGPTQPGVTTPDPTATSATPATGTRARPPRTGRPADQRTASKAAPVLDYLLGR